MTALPTSLPELVRRMGAAISAAVIERYPPRYTPQVRKALGFDGPLRSLKRRPLGAQGDIARALAMELREGRSALLVAEMGVGKTFCAIAAAYLAGKRRVLVLAPPHLVLKWKREIEMTVPLPMAPVIARTPAELERALAAAPFTRLLWVIVPDTAAKLGYGWRPSYVVRRGHGSVLACPDCGNPVVDPEGNPLGHADLAPRKRRCGATVRRGRGDERVCRAALWSAQATPVGQRPFPGLGEPGSGPRRVPLADYVARRCPRFFDLLIADEIHRYKARGSAQGFALGTLARACPQALGLTGTLMSGYASSLFYLLHRLVPTVRREFRWTDEPRWVERYGRLERVTHKDTENDVVEDGSTSRRRAYRTTLQEKPGVSPMVLLHLIGCAVFAKLADVASDLPPYTEHVSVVPLNREPVAGIHADGAEEATSQEGAYTALADALHQRLIQLLQAGSKRLLGAYVQALLAYPDGCTCAEVVVEPGADAVVGRAPGLPAERLYPKERLLVELCQAQRAARRRVLVFVTNTDKRDLTPRLRAVLEQAGLRVAVLKADTVRPDAREAWVKRQVESGGWTCWSAIPSW